LLRSDFLHGDICNKSTHTKEARVNRHFVVAAVLICAGITTGDASCLADTPSAIGAQALRDLFGAPASDGHTYGPLGPDQPKDLDDPDSSNTSNKALELVWTMGTATIAGKQNVFVVAKGFGQSDYHIGETECVLTVSGVCLDGPQSDNAEYSVVHYEVDGGHANLIAKGVNLDEEEALSFAKTALEVRNLSNGNLGILLHDGQDHDAYDSQQLDVFIEKSGVISFAGDVPVSGTGPYPTDNGKYYGYEGAVSFSPGASGGPDNIVVHYSGTVPKDMSSASKRIIETATYKFSNGKYSGPLAPDQTQ